MVARGLGDIANSDELLQRFKRRMTLTSGASTTLILLAYNHEAFIGEALSGAIAQDHPNLEIVVTDDASSDRTGYFISEAARETTGPHPLRVITNPVNMGLSATLNRAMEASSGTLVIVAAGDDVAYPHRASSLVSCYESQAAAPMAIYSNAHVIDSEGHIERDLYPLPPDERRHHVDWAAKNDFGIFGATMAWHRDVFDLFGPLPAGIVMEDLVIPFRAALLGTIHYLSDPLIKYRRHSGNVFLGRVSPTMTSDEWHRAMSLETAQRIVALKCRLYDLQTARSLFPERMRQLDALSRSTENTIRRAEDRLAIFNGAGPVRKISAVYRTLRHGLPARRVAQQALTAFAPNLYLKRMHRNRPATFSREQPP